MMKVLQYFLILSFLFCQAFYVSAIDNRTEAELLIKVGDSLRDLKAFEEALNFYRKAENLNHVKNTLNIRLKSILKIAEMERELGLYDKSIQTAQKGTELSSTNQEKLFLAEFEIEKGKTFLLKGNNSSALESFQQALKLSMEASERPESKLLTECYGLIGDTYVAMHIYDSAIVNLEKKLKTLNKIPERDNYKLAPTLNSLGLAYLGRKNYKISKSFLDSSYNLVKDHYGNLSTELGSIYGNLGTYYKSLALYDSALYYYGLALPKHVAKLGESHPEVAAELINLGDLFLKKGDFKSGLKKYKESLSIHNKIGKTENAKVAFLYYKISGAYIYMNQFDLALEYIDFAIDVVQVEGEKEDGLLMWFFSRKTTLMERLNQYEMAFSIYKESTNKWGTNRPSAANDNYTIGRLFGKMGNEDSAVYYLKKSLDIEKKVYGDSHPQIAWTLLRVSDSYRKMGQMEEALKGIFKVLEIQKKYYGDKHYSVGSAYRILANLYYDLGLYGESLKANQNALIANALDFNDSSIVHNPLGVHAQNVTDLFITLLQKALCFEQIGGAENLNHALNCYYQADNVLKEIRRDKTNLKDKMTFEAHANQMYQRAVSVCMKLNEMSKDAKYLEEAYVFTEKNRRGNLSQAVAKNSAEDFEILPRSIIQIEDQIKVDQNFYENQIKKMKASKDGYDTTKLVNLESLLFGLNRKRDSLVGVFEKDFPRYYQLKYYQDISGIKELKNNLPGQTVLLEYFEGDSTIYLFAIAKNDFRVSVIPSKGEINNQIDLFREIQYYWSISDQSDSTYLSYVRCSSYLKSSLLGDNIDDFLEKNRIQNLVIVPDGKLSYLPFEILLTDDNFKQVGDYSSLPYLIKDYNISYAYSATLNFEFNNRLRKGPSPRGYIGFAPSYTTLPLDSSNLLAIGKFRSSVTNLEWNKEEVLTSSSLIGGEYRLENDATESKFKEDASNYNILHLAMHALIDDEDPMLSKLVFAKDENDSINDGLLHTYEIFNMNMNPELVVLSACNTGFGKLERGEGVNSLAYAFAYAGCPSIVMSQWQVDDKSTSILMKDFFENLSGGMSKSKALREAKLKFLNDPSSRYANPSYWAGFVLIGNEDALDQYNGYDLFYIWIGVGMAILVVGFLIIRRRNLSV
ncbi:MAG: CHAT domain-containing tetratricopeptide repeat protein [Reichenbachiella sp.]|uniref:CHAT domain-containing protein n=1 Tax=Reichenbachiella sp. TaxID=2184521 RepID=UPI003297891A